MRIRDINQIVSGWRYLFGGKIVTVLGRGKGTFNEPVAEVTAPDYIMPQLIPLQHLELIPVIVQSINRLGISIN